MKLIDDLAMAAKVAAANDRDGIAQLCLRAISVIAVYSQASRDLCEASKPSEITDAKKRLLTVIEKSESV